MTREPRCRYYPIGWACDRYQHEQSTVDSRLSLRTNPKLIGLVCGCEGCSATDVELVMI